LHGTPLALAAAGTHSGQRCDHFADPPFVTNKQITPSSRQVSAPFGLLPMRMDAPGFHAPLLEERELTTQRQVLGLDGSPGSDRERDQSGQVGQQPKDDAKQNDHAPMMPQPAISRAVASVQPRSNICGAQPDGWAPEEMRDWVTGDYVARYLLLHDTIVVLRIWHGRENRS
jgi:hypothetical protein